MSTTDLAALGTVSGVLLAAVFAWAGIAKLRRPPVDTFAALGVPAPRAMAVAVPLAELVLALLLLGRPRLGGVVALGLLAAFSALLADRLRRGTTVSCGCLGTGRTAPLSVIELLRNALLAALALVALAAPTPAPLRLDAVLAVGAAAVVGLLVLALADLRRETGRLWDNTVEPGPHGLLGADEELAR